MLKIFIFVLIILFIFLEILNRRLLNPYKLYIIIGNKGTGKTAYMTWLAHKYSKKGWSIYTNFGIFNPLKSDYYNYSYPENSVLFIDETGLIHDNRSFKTFPKQATELYKYQRKRKLIIYLASQTVDVDKKIRDVADYHILLRRFLPFVIPVYYRRISRVIHNEQTGITDIGDTLITGLIPIKLSHIFLLNSVIKKFDTRLEITNTPNQQEPKAQDTEGVKPQ